MVLKSSISRLLPKRAAMRWLLIFLFSLQLVAPVRAQVLERERLVGTQALDQELLGQLDLRLKLNSLILEVAAQIDREHPALTPWMPEDRITAVFKEKAKHYAEFYLARIDNLGPQQKSVFLRAFEKIQWHNIVKLWKQSSLGIQTMFKRKGFGIAIAIILGLVSEYMVPLILTNLNLHWLLPIAPFIPYQVIYSLVPKKIIDLRIRLKLSRSLGGHRAYQAYMHQEKLVRANLKKMKVDDLLLPLGENLHATEVVSLGHSRWFKSLIQRFGFNDSTFTYTTLRSFMRENEIHDDYIKMIVEHPRMKDWQKAALITPHLFETLEEEKLTLFRERFDKSILQLRSLSPWEGFEKWTGDLLRAKSVAEINQLLLEVPPGTPSRLILDVWDKIVLPKYASHTKFNYFHYRRLVEDFSVMRAEILNNAQEGWNLSVHQKFLHYLGTSVGDKAFTDCQNSGQQVLRFLLTN